MARTPTQRRAQAALAAVKSIDGACRAMHRYLQTARECGEHLRDDDDCEQLIALMSARASRLWMVFNVPPQQHP